MAVSLEEQESIKAAFTALKEAAEQRMDEIRREVRAPLVAQIEKEFEAVMHSDGLKIN